MSKEKINDASEKQNKAEIKKAKKLNKKKEKQILSVNKRPIICPPDRAGMGLSVRILGYVCRAFVIFAAVFGLVFFICDALRLELQEITVSAGYLALVCLIPVAVFSAMKTSKYGLFAGIAAIIASFSALVISEGAVEFVDFFVKTALTFKNVVLTRLYNLGYYTMSKYMSEVSYSYHSAEYYLKAAFALIAIVFALVFVLSCIKRVKVVYPAILSVIIISPIFIYNISRSNWAVSFLIASFSALLVMAAYDRIFVAKPADGSVDNETVLFADEEAPTMPEGVVTPEMARVIRREKKEEFRALKKKHRKDKTEITVDEELSAYFGTSVKSKKEQKPEKVKLSPEQIKAEKAKKRELNAKLKEYTGYNTAVNDSRSAQGGFAAFGTLIIVTLMLIIPASTVSGAFRTIKVIDDKMETYREYVTALLMGDDPILDELGYENDKNNFTPHSTDLNPQYYTGKKIMTVQTQYPVNVYLRGWIGTDYENGAWLAVDRDTREEYKKLYGTTGSPAETLFNNFFTFMDEGMVDEIDFTKRYINKSKYGYIALQVNTTREETNDSLAYLPAVYRVNDVVSALRADNRGLYDIGTSEPIDDTFVNYFDGLYTGRHFLSEMSYASVAYVTTMKNADRAKTVASLLAEYNVGYNDAYDAIKSYADKKTKGKSANIDSITEKMFTNTPDNIVSVSEDDTHIELVVQYAKGKALYTINKADGKVESSKIIELTEYERFDEETGETEIYTVAFPVPQLSLELRYIYCMTQAERRSLAYAYYYRYVYENFIYKNYTKKADSSVIDSVYKTVMDEISVDVTYNTTFDDDTLLSVTEKIVTPNPEKFARAAERDPLDAEVYEQRNDLAMGIIDYLKENYTYSLTPSGPINENYNGVENFLAVTKEGYCVQFASSVALMLRKAGIPCRYVEGYVACDMYKNYADDAVASYATTVRDYNKHAWVEVWFDGIGWVQYETTSVYYSDMYENASSSTSGGNIRPWYDSIDESTEEEQLLESLLSSIDFADMRADSMLDDVAMMIGSREIKNSLHSIKDRIKDYRGYQTVQVDYYYSHREYSDYDANDFIANLKSLQQSFAEGVDDALDYQQLKIDGLVVINSIIRIVFIVILGIAAIVILIVIADKRAKEIEKKRASTADAVISGNIQGDKEESHKTALFIIDSLYSLLAAYGTSPKAGEFRNEYAERLQNEYINEFGRLKHIDENDENATALVSEIDFAKVFEAISKEEFGYGMDNAEMKLVAEFYKAMRNAAPRRLNKFQKLYYHFIKHII